MFVRQRRSLLTALSALAVLSTLLGCGGAPDASDSQGAKVEGRIAPLLENLGNLHKTVTTNQPTAQRFFDQGLTLLYGFNHLEGIRSFQEAARLDPTCAMAHWGQALGHGPNINDPMTPERGQKAHDAIQKALALKSEASEKEQAYIDALATRYSAAEDQDRAALDSAYSEAMAQLHRRYPDDPDAATLYAAAVMNTMPWDYWTKDGQPKPGTEKVIATLESVMKSHPDHPGGHHYYIHIVEASTDPDRAIASADRLGSLVPGAGHLVHMPAHIYIRVGRYADASEANVRAIAADEDYITQCRSQGIYPVAYYPHNIHFLWASATMEGRSGEAIAAARKVSKKGLERLDELPPWALIFPVIKLCALTRFGKWDELLEEPPPPAQLLFATAIWHYARGTAFTRKGQMDEAGAELAKLEAIAGDDSLSEAKAGASPAPTLLAIATETLAGEMAAQRGKTPKAVGHLKKAVQLQDGLPYNEPPDWHYPVRQSLGAVLLDAGRAAEAESVYREDLKRNRENGWSLFGLMQSLKAQGKAPEAGEVEQSFRKVWARADIQLVASRF